MGIDYEDFLNLTWKEYDYICTGYERRLQRQWDYTRHIIASQYNSTGMSKKTIKVTDIMKLSLFDTKKPEKIKLMEKATVDKLIKILAQT